MVHFVWPAQAVRRQEKTHLDDALPRLLKRKEHSITDIHPLWQVGRFLSKIFFKKHLRKLLLIYQLDSQKSKKKKTKMFSFYKQQYVSFFIKYNNQIQTNPSSHSQNNLCKVLLVLFVTFT